MQSAVFTLPLLETLKWIRKTPSLHARKPGTVLSGYEAIVSDHKALGRHRLAFCQEPSDFFQYVQVLKIPLLKDWSNI